jgi:hypothetical protein
MPRSASAGADLGFTLNRHFKMPKSARVDTDLGSTRNRRFKMPKSARADLGGGGGDWGGAADRIPLNLITRGGNCWLRHPTQIRFDRGKTIDHVPYCTVDRFERVLGAALGCGLRLSELGHVMLEGLDRFAGSR